MSLLPRGERTAQISLASCQRAGAVLLPIKQTGTLLVNSMLSGANPRSAERGFSFAYFWFGYYFGGNYSSPQAEERWAVS